MQGHHKVYASTHSSKGWLTKGLTRCRATSSLGALCVLAVPSTRFEPQQADLDFDSSSTRLNQKLQRISGSTLHHVLPFAKNLQQPCFPAAQCRRLLPSACCLPEDQ